MARRRLLWHLYPTYIAVILLCIGAVGVYAVGSVKAFYLAQTAEHLEIRARFVERHLAERIGKGEDLDALAKRLGKAASTRITVIGPSGRVVGDSEADAAAMENHADRPEFRQALAGEVGRDVRIGHTLGHEMMYVAVPLTGKGGIEGAVRTSIPLTEIGRALDRIYARIAAGALVVALAAAGLGLWVSRRLSRPLEEIGKGAERFAAGEFDRKLPIPDSEEVGGLAESLNRMAAQLDEKIRTLARQKNEQEAVLSSMIEGVLAVDADERIISLNVAAAGLLGIDPASAPGRALPEVLRNVDLGRFVASVLASREPVDGEIVLRSGAERAIQVRGAVLRDARGREIGAVIVLNDVTRLRRLETIRRDFVANVSHELKTPITSIKGFVETLRDGAIADPEKARRFLEIVARHADRLNSIIEDLLTLSQVELETGRETIPMQDAKLLGVLNDAIGDCAPKAADRNVRIELACDEAVRLSMNAPLIEQAVANLIDNAIKYSQPGSEVRVEAERAGGEVVIRVLDSGCGIEREHLPRLFERFYRVDKARSRELGGTGLGLAIVKHIVLVHRGRVEVESAPGKGSTFTIRLPAQTPANAPRAPGGA